MGDQRITADYAAIMLELLAISAQLARVEDRLAKVDPLLPHIPAAVKLLDNPAVKWKRRRDERADTRA